MPAGRGRIRLTTATIALVVLQSAVASAMQGQVVRGRLVDEGDNAAIAGAMITLVDRDGRDPEVMAGVLRSLPGQDRPSERMAEGMLNGLEQVELLTATWLPDMNRQAVT